MSVIARTWLKDDWSLTKKFEYLGFNKITAQALAKYLTRNPHQSPTQCAFEYIWTVCSFLDKYPQDKIERTMHFPLFKNKNITYKPIPDLSKFLDDVITGGYTRGSCICGDSDCQITTHRTDDEECIIQIPIEQIGEYQLAKLKGQAWPSG